MHEPSSSESGSCMHPDWDDTKNAFYATRSRNLLDLGGEYTDYRSYLFFNQWDEDYMFAIEVSKQ